MLTVNTLFEKNKFHKSQTETLLMVEIKAPKKEVKDDADNKRLNIALAIDISGSMGSPVEGFGNRSSHSAAVISSISNRPRIGNPFDQYKTTGITQPHDPYNLPQMPQPAIPLNPPVFNNPVQEQKIERTISKLEQAKRAAIKALDIMRNGDIISLVAFDSSVTVILPATEISSSNRELIKEKINSLHVRGTTNIYDGWHAAASEVAKNLKAEYINRVIVLTDGQTNAGLTNTDQICSNVLIMKNSSISTSTFGIGEDFNEDLLQGMANSGDGNAYYIDSDNKLEQMFKDEFKGLSNLYATDVKLSFENINSTIKEQLNGFIEQEGQYLLPNFISEGKNSVVFKLELTIPEDSKKLDLGKIVIKYKDCDGQYHEVSTKLAQSVISKKKWDDLSFNDEVKVQEALMKVANEKIKATQALSMGDYDSAKTILAGAMAAVNSVSIKDSRLFSETASLESSLSRADTTSIDSFKKSLSYESYATRSGRNKE